MLHFKTKNKLNWKILSFKEYTFRIKYFFLFIYIIFLLFSGFFTPRKISFFYKLNKVTDLKFFNLKFF